MTGHEDGFLCVGQIGGIDPRVLPDRDFIVMTDPPRFGVASVQPPHVLNAEDMEKALKLEDIRIDVGLSQEEAVRQIPIGTPLTYRTAGFEMKNGRYVSKTLDDRACFAILIMAAALIKDKKLPWDVYFVGSTGEERGEGGAPAAVFNSGAEVCIAIDVTQATTPDAGADKYAHELGKGPVISIGPNITRRIGKRLQELADKHSIPVQMAAVPGRSGTDAWTMHIVREGVASGIIGLPLRYMHSPAECVDISDMEQCAKLVAAFAEEGTEDAAKLSAEKHTRTEAQK